MEQAKRFQQICYLYSLAPLLQGQPFRVSRFESGAEIGDISEHGRRDSGIEKNG